MMETTFQYLLLDSFLSLSKEGKEKIETLEKELKRRKLSGSTDDNNSFNHDWDPKVREILYSKNEAIQDDPATIDQFEFKNVGVYPQSRY
ncbi:MAG: hypothetical protein GWP06_07980 [Actinobacteria bacterium]|nr:hypothetical protein [Actinomycetota bacterium]